VGKVKLRKRVDKGKKKKEAGDSLYCKPAPTARITKNIDISSKNF